MNIAIDLTEAESAICNNAIDVHVDGIETVANNKELKDRRHGTEQWAIELNSTSTYK